MLKSEFIEKFCFSVSHTTRAKRKGETNGINYHYIEREEFEQVLI
jgi:guanylate kinase